MCVCACVRVCLALHWLFSQTLSNSITHTPSYTYILHIQTHTHTHTQAGLQPRDSVEVLYKVQEVGGETGGVSLTRVIEEHKEYIETTTKGPVTPWTSNSDLSKTIVEEKQKVLC